MKKKRVLILLSVLLSILLTVIIVYALSVSTFGKRLKYYFTHDAYGKEYEKVWISSDGKMRLVCDNILGLAGVGRYDGTLVIDGNTYEI